MSFFVYIFVWFNYTIQDINDLELGMTVEIIFNEGVMESDPVKGTAKVIKFINE